MAIGPGVPAGSAGARAGGGGWRAATGEAAPLAHLRAKPDASLAELRRWLLEALGVSLGVGALWRRLGRPGWTLEKGRSAAEQERPDVAAARARWRDGQPGLNPARPVFLGESGFGTDMGRRHCRLRHPAMPQGAQRACRHRGARRRTHHLPPCSPDMNPIEQVFAKLKNLVRAATPRNIETPWDSLGRSLSHSPPTECANCIAHSGHPRMT